MGVSENRGTLFWGPYNKDPTIEGFYISVPNFRKLLYRFLGVVTRSALGLTSSSFSRQEKFQALPLDPKP